MDKKYVPVEERPQTDGANKRKTINGIVDKIQEGEEESEEE